MPASHIKDVRRPLLSFIAALRAFSAAQSRLARCSAGRKLTLAMQKSTFSITTTTPQRTKQLNLTSPSLVAVQQQQEGFQMVLQWVAWSAMCTLELNSLSGEKLT
jgi:hypothetical protein